MLIEDAGQRFKRYERAASKMINWRSTLEEAYDYYAPGQANFNDKTPGQVRDEKIFDPIPELAIHQHANNIQQTLMPPFQKWAELQVGSIANTQQAANIDMDAVREELQLITDTFFKYLNLSNFNQEVAVSLRDAAISTGILLLNEGDIDNPFEFKSIPIDVVAVEAGPSGKLENFWMKRKIPARFILRKWPKATLSKFIDNKIKNDPDYEFTLIEGTIFYPEKSGKEKYLYYIQDSETKEDIYSEWREFSPWIGYRENVRTMETLGWGPAMTALSAVKVLNKLEEYELKAAAWKAYPAYMANDSESFNPYMVRLDPGSIIPIGGMALGAGVDPIRPVPTNGDPQFAQLLSQNLQNTINEILLVNPLPPDGLPNQTATAVSIIQNNWIKRAAIEFGRLTNELLSPIVLKGLMILKKKGLLPVKELKIDGKVISIKYNSPLIDIQRQEELAKIEQFMTSVAQLYGPEAVLAVANPADVITKLAADIGVDATIVKSKDELQAVMQRIVGAANNQQQQQMQAQQDQQNQQQNVVQ